MAYEGVNIAEGTGVAVATDTVSGQRIQVVKLDVGADGVASGPVSSTNPMPVALDAASLAALENISVTVTSPTGGSTAANQTTIIGHLDGVETALGLLATAAAQTTANTALAAIQTAIEILDNIVSGSEAQVDVVSSALPTGAATLAEQQTQTTAVGALTEAAPASDTASSGLNGRLQRIAQRITTLIGLLPASLGKKTASASLSVTMASDESFSAIISTLPLPTGAATSALQGGGLPAALGAGGGVKVDGSGTALPVSAAALPLPSGAATSALQGGGLPAALGQGTMAQSLRVVLPSDQTVAVGGAAAHDAVVAGNPVLVGAVANASAPVAVADGDAVRVWAGRSGSVVIAAGGGTLGDGNAATFAITDTGSTGRPLATAGFSWSGSAFDRTRGNVDATALASAARTTTTSSSDLTNYNGRGVHVVLDMTAVGTGSVTLAIEGKDAVSGKYYAILTGAAVTTNSTNRYTVYPGATVAANVSASDVIPRVWRVTVTANNANSATYSVGTSTIL